MIVDKNILDLICDLEYEIAHACHNDNTPAYKRYRYPIWVDYYPSENEPYFLRNTGRLVNINLKQLDTMHYKFGNNRLLIGSAIIKVLRLLEKRYDIDFSQLKLCKHCHDEERLAEDRSQ